MMNKLVKDNSARTNPTAGPRDRRFSSESPLTDEPGTSKTLPIALLVTAGYSPDTYYYSRILRQMCYNLVKNERNWQNWVKSDLFEGDFPPLF